MLLDCSELKNIKNFEADICIMGCGVAGIVLANELKEYFSNILVLESGGENYKQETQELYAANKVEGVYANPLYSRLRFLGGSSNHWANNTSLLSPIDFEKRDWIENSGWPISYEDVFPYYKKAAKYCQTGIDGYDTNEWLTKLNIKNPYKDSRYTEVGIAKAAVPPTRFFAVYGNELVKNNNVTIIKEANVVDIDYDDQAKKVNKAYFKSLGGSTHSVSAQYFIMCFGGIENARMLLHFNNKYNNELGNEHDNVGRYFMDHPTLRAAQLFASGNDFNNLTKTEYNRYLVAFFQLKESALKDHQTTNLRLPLDRASEYELSDGISSYHILKNKLFNFEVPDHFGKHIANFVTDIDMVIEAISRKEFDKQLFESANEFSGYQIPLMMEQTPHRDNTIKLSKQKDKLGIPKIEIEWELKKEDQNRLWKSLELFANDTGALSLGRIRLLKERSSRLFGDQIGFGNHHMGTTRMAIDDKNGVVDSDQKVFGTNNFYMGGSSVFPTGGHVPPTLTITALSIRLAKHLIEEKKNG